MKIKSLSLLTAGMLMILPGITACDHSDDTKDASASSAPAENASPAASAAASAGTASASPADASTKSTPAGPAAEADGFSIVPPTGWTKGEAKDKTIMVYLAPPEDDFKPNFNVNSSPDDGTPVDKIGELIKPMFAKQFQKWKSMGEGTVDIDGEKSYYISSNFSMNGKDIQNLQYYIRGKSKKFYVLTFTALSKNYASLENTFKATAATVKTK